jgi:hypothetical protein
VPAKDPAKRRATVRAWYARTRDDQAPRIRARNKKRKQALASWYAELKSVLVCRRCGEDHPACIQFHHADPSAKEVLISEAVRRGWGRARILSEIAKCEVLCANCHAKHHALERTS